MISLRKVDCSMRSQKEKNKEIEIEIEGNLEDLLTEEELKQLEEDEYLDGGPGYIPTWSRMGDSPVFPPRDTLSPVKEPEMRKPQSPSHARGRRTGGRRGCTLSDSTRRRTTT